MIQRNGFSYELQCDFCSNYIDDLVDFQDAVDYKKANGWKSVKVQNEWLDKCKNCVESEVQK